MHNTAYQIYVAEQQSHKHAHAHITLVNYRKAFT